MTADVLAVGPLIEHPDDDDEGAMANAKLIKPGVTLAFSKYSPTEFEYENEKYLIIALKDVLAVVEK
jgi:co-chaperonin GroES (HSP10)